MAYTQEEKAILVEQFQRESERNLEQIRQISEKISRAAEQKVLRRLNGVSVTLWNVKIRDVLKVERHHKPSIKSLLQDVRALQENALKGIQSDTEASFLLGSLEHTRDRTNTAGRASYNRTDRSGTYSSQSRLDRSGSAGRSINTTGRIEKPR